MKKAKKHPMRGNKGKQRPGKQERFVKKVEGPKRLREGEYLLTGELRIHRDGYGFVNAVKAGEDDLFIPARFIGDALHTDVVEARAVGGREGKLEGRIVRIVEHSVKELMGRLEQQGKVYQVVADDRRVRHRIQIATDAIGKARHGQNVVVEILKYPHGDEPMVGRVTKILGERGERATELEAVIARHQLKVEFPRKAILEAERSVELMDESAMEGRRDLREIPFVTIDGETAQDFDDAVAVEKLEGDLIRLYVSIADVSFFVRPQSALDQVAYERGTSVYFPGYCIPMLPEGISNNLCSLRPHEDRYTFTAEMKIDRSGNVVSEKFYRSVINSRERMTYTAVKEMLVDKNATVRKRYEKLLPAFELMEECYGRLREFRTSRGSIDFDLPESQILIDMQGDIDNIVKAERHVGHSIIEEFMIAANESVARFLTAAGGGCVYRIHEAPPPEKMADFSILLHNLGYKFNVGAKPSPRSLAEVVKGVQGKPEERLVNHALLRAMSQAVYSPENKGHFGLASKCYCHFTSPIRRYPDLVTHRLLANALNKRKGGGKGGKKDGLQSGLKEISEFTSRRERIAVEAEREVAKLYSALFMKDRIGEEFDGIIARVTKFGFFVELQDFFVEGLVHISALDDDYYVFDEKASVLNGRKKKRSFKIGDRVRIEVEEVDIPNREIMFCHIPQN